MQTQEERLNIRFRIYNRGTQPVTISPDDITLTLGYEPDPSGPRMPAEGLESFILLPEQVADLRLVWQWNGKASGTLKIHKRKYVLEVYTP